MVKAATPDREVLPGETVTYTVTVENVSDEDLWDLISHDDLSGVLDDADFNDDVSFTPSWTGSTPTPGTDDFDAATELLELRINVPAGETLVITYSVTVRGD